MKQLPLSNSDFNAFVDDEDFERCAKIKWRLLKKGYVGTSLDSGRSYIFLHNFILDIPNGSGVDHIDRRKLNNTKDNLRLVDNSQSGQNRGIFRNNTSGYRGVSIKKQTGRYAAYIKVNYKNVHLGYYDTAEEAAKVYDDAAKTYFGPEATTNF